MSAMATLRKWRTYDAPEKFIAARSGSATAEVGMLCSWRTSSVETRGTPPSSCF